MLGELVRLMFEIIEKVNRIGRCIRPRLSGHHIAKLVDDIKAGSETGQSRLRWGVASLGDHRLVPGTMSA